METNYIAVTNSDCFNFAKSTLIDFNIKLLPYGKQLQQDETGFGIFNKHINYFFLLRKIKLNYNYPKYQINQSQAYIKLIKLNELNKFKTGISYKKFENEFFDWTGHYRSFGVGTLVIETKKDFLERCKKIFSQDHFFSITPIITGKYVDNAFLIDEIYFPSVIKLLTEICSQFEDKSITNYLIIPEISELNNVIEDLQEALRSWGN